MSTWYGLFWEKHRKCCTYGNSSRLYVIKKGISDTTLLMTNEKMQKNSVSLQKYKKKKVVTVTVQ